MALLDPLIAQIARDKEVKTSAANLLTGLKAKLDAAGTDAVKLKELSDSLGTQTDDLVTAMVTNTPAEDEPPNPEARRR